MFPAATYVARRARLGSAVGSGLVLFLGHAEAPRNALANPYPFRQDSSFLYFFGLDHPGLAAVVDLDAGHELLFGDDPSTDDLIWSGPQPSMEQRAGAAGVARTAPRSALGAAVAEAVRLGRRIHFLPPYRAETCLELAQLAGVSAAQVPAMASQELVEAVVALRSIKAPEEVEEITRALETTRRMHLLAMRTARPGVHEQDVAGAVEGEAAAHGARLAFAVIFSVRGEVLHNHAHTNRLAAGQMAVHDSGAESPFGYAGDVTRTLPVGGRFDPVQRALYEAVLAAQAHAIEAIRPGVPYRDVHLLAARVLAEGLAGLGCLRGDLDEAVAAGAHALFFPHGLGHMLGLDVHDMESLGEDRVGYDANVRRSPQFGLRSLRLGRALEPGFVLTVEPGLYFIPGLIDLWKAGRRCAGFIDYEAVERLRHAGGIRIEDNVVVTATGCRVLGPPIPRAPAEVEALASA
jgi:Xaa-Pro aminopeptidase